MNTNTNTADASTPSTEARRAGRARWAAIGAAIAVSVGAGGLMSASAAVSSGERATYVPISPCRVMDTRSAPETKGPRSTPLTAGDTHTITVWGVQGDCTIPNEAVGVVMNVAVVNPTANSFLTVFPAGGSAPLAANLNWVAGQPPVSNSVTANLSADGKVSFFNKFGTVNVAADIVGYYVDHHHDDRYYTKSQTVSMQAFAQVMPQGQSSLVAERSNGFASVTRTAPGVYCVALVADSPYDTRKVSASVTVEYGNTTTAGFAEIRGASACADPKLQFEVRTFDVAGAPSNLIAFNIVVPVHVESGLVVIPV